MNISSILITLVGIIIIIALYVVSRVSQNNMPKKEVTKLPKIKDENGDEFTSILDDIPASDGSTPNKENKTPTKESSKKQQIVLFISAENEAELDGNIIKQALVNNGLKLGDKDIYHYLIENPTEENQLASLFRIANGVEPWTLTDKDLEDKQLVGLSMVMLLPNVINNKAALKKYLEIADVIAEQTKGILKNQQQEKLTNKERKALLTS